MAVGEFPFPAMTEVAGCKLASVAAGIKKNGSDDMVLIELAEGSSVAGVFTQNAFCAAPVTLCREHLSAVSQSQEPGIRYLLINSGNANACTGEQGMADAKASCAKVAELTGVSAAQVLPFSTGVIGELLPVPTLLSGIESLLPELSGDAWLAAGKGIMTTDTREKGARAELQINGQRVVVQGIAKGSGMIKPNMATMLAYIVTDAKIAQPMLEQMVKTAADLSFNRITVDGDTSTNDSCMLAATGQVEMPEVVSENDPGFSELSAAFNQVLITLAKSIVADGEGATKFVTINVRGGANTQEVLDVAYSVAHSPLVKTALFASDPNWGRIVAAIGYAGVPNLDSDIITVHLNDVLIVEKGGRAASYTEQAGQAVMDGEEIAILIDLGRGTRSETLWTSDLSHEYVRINAEYRS